MMLNVHRNQKAYQGRGEGGMEVGEEREIIYLSPHCHHQNDSCTKMGIFGYFVGRFYTALFALEQTHCARM